MKSDNYEIDFVIPWVDDSDKEWRKQKNHYWGVCETELNQDGNNAARYRDWDNLQYWFRGVEKFAPWVHKIYFVTWGHLPKWLNVNHPKLVIVNHKDYIPEEYLPVFSANPIEINFHRIKGLEEHFVYFNDDMFLINPVQKNDFFVNGLPREMAVRYPLYTNRDNETFQHMLFTMTGIINSTFNTAESIQKNKSKWYNLCYGKYLLNNICLSRFPWTSGLMIPHVPSALRKSTMEEVWNTIEPEMKETSSHRFREMNDITQYMFRYWEMMKGTFEPTNIFKYAGEFFCTDDNNSPLLNTIKRQSKKMICINDSIKVADMSKAMTNVKEAFDSILPEKSAFEI